MLSFEPSIITVAASKRRDEGWKKGKLGLWTPVCRKNVEFGVGWIPPDSNDVNSGDGIAGFAI